MWTTKQIEQKNLHDEFEIKLCSIKEYEKLKMFHYINYSYPGGYRETYGLYNKGILYGLIIFSVPILELTARNKTPYGKYLQSIKNKNMRYKLLNSQTSNISRVIIHPSIRGIGAAKLLIGEAIKRQKRDYIEIMATMLYYGNFCPGNYNYYIKVKKKLPFEALSKGRKGPSYNRTGSAYYKYGYVQWCNG